MIDALFGSPIAIIGTILLAVFIGTLVLLVARMRHRPNGHDIATLSWLVHGTIFYFAVLVLRWRGVHVGGPFTELITLWSSALRLHIVVSAGATEILRRHYGRAQ